jgi:hypothetical protein
VRIAWCGERINRPVTRPTGPFARWGVLVGEMGRNYPATPAANVDKAFTLRPMQAAVVTHRIAFGHERVTTW